MARHRRANYADKVRLLGVVRRKRAALMVSTALQATVILVLSQPAHAQPAPNARPTGGNVIAGSAAISATSNNTRIDQSTQRAAIDWKTFNVGSQQSVTFNQPAPSSVTVNRVTGPDPSQIAGHISANGQLVLINQSGVTFFQGAQVNANGLVVSAIGASDQSVKNFVGSNSGKLALDRPGNPNAKVDNQGNITIKDAGLAALVAPQVANSGTITARLGHVVLAGAKTTTIDLYGDGMLSLDVTNQVTETPRDANGNAVTALVTNSGNIIADGGTVQLTARAADGIVQNLVQAGGKIRAATMGDQTGTVALNGVGGSIVVEGQLSAPGYAPGTKGGNIEVATTGNVVVAPTARINASGKAGGGNIGIGTSLDRVKGGPSVTPAVVAANTTIGKGAAIKANATQKGDGGHIVVLSSDTTHMNGAISATGGKLGGDGGFVEVSGKNLGITGAIDVWAPAGNLGTVLLDPDFLDIVAGDTSSGAGTENPNFSTNSGTVVASDGLTGTPDTVSNGIINAFTGNVLLQANKTLTVAAPISLTSKAGQNLTLEAGGTLTVNSGIAVTASGDVILATGGAGPGTPPPAQASPLISLLGTVSSTAGSVSLLSGAGGTISIGATGLVSVPTAGKLATLQTDTLAIAAGGTVSAATGTIEIAPATSGNAIDISGTGAGTLTLTQATLSRMSASALRLGSVAIGGTETTTAGSITFDSNLNVTGIASTLDLQTTGAVTDTASGVLTVGTLTGSASGGLALTAVNTNSIGTVGSFAATAGDFNLKTTGALAIAGPVTGTKIDIETSGGGSAITVTGSAIATAKTTLNSGAITLNTGADVEGPAVFLISGGTIALNGTAKISAASGADLKAGGDVTEAATATINAPSLQSTGGITGNVSLLGTTNTFDQLNDFTVGGDFSLRDANALSVPGALNATSGNVFLESSNAGGIKIGATGQVNAGAAKRASFQSQALTIDIGGAVTGGTLEFGLDTPGALTLGSGGSLATLAGVTTSNVVIGGVTPPGGSFTISATSIDTVATFDAKNLPLALNTTGTIGEAAGAPITNVSTLTGSATAVKLDQSNNIANVGSFTASSGTFLMTDGSLAGTLTVSGPLTSITNNVTLSGSPALNVTGSIGAAGTVSLNSVEIDLSSGAVVTGPTVKLNAGATGIAFTGNASIGQGGGIVDINSAGVVNEASTAVIIAGTLEATSGLSGDVKLLGTANAIDILGNIPLGSGVNFGLVDASSLNVTGTVAVAVGSKQLFIETPGISISAGGQLSADNASGLVSLQTDTFANKGTISAATVELAPNTAGRTVSLGSGSGLLLPSLSGIGTGNLIIGAVTPPGGAQTTTAGAITIGGTFDTTGVSVVILDGSGAVTQSAPLIGGSQLSGTAASFTLLNGGNKFATLGLTATGGDIEVSDATALSLSANKASGNIYIATPSATLTGAVSAGGTLGLQTDSFTFIAGSLSGTTVELAPLTSGTTETLGAAGGLSLIDSSIITGNLRIGAVTVPGSGLTTTAGTIVVGDNFGTGGLALELDSKGGIGEVTGKILTAGTLSGSAAATVALTNANAIGAIATFIATGASSDFQLGDTAALTVSGNVSAGHNVYLQTSNASGISVTGTVAANASGTAGLQADAIGITGTVTAGTVELAPNSAFAVTLGGAGGLSLSKATLSKIGAGTLRIGAVTEPGSGLTTTSTAIAVGGTVDLSGITTLDLQSSGGVTETGELDNVGTLIGTTGAVALTGGTDSGIGTIGTYTVTGGGDFLMQNASSTGIAGTLSANNVSIVENGATSMNVTGTVAATGTTDLHSQTITLATTANVQGTTITLGSHSIALNGSAVLGKSGQTTVVDMTADATGITEASTATINAGTLQSTVGVIGDVSLLGTANAIGNLGKFTVTGGQFLLKDASALTVAGALSASGNVYLESSGGSIGIGAAGKVAAGAASLASFQADAFSIAAGGTVTGGTFEFAPNTAGSNLTLGAGGVIASLAGIGTTNLELGGVTIPGTGFTVTASAINTVGTFDGKSLPVALNTTGTIAEGAGAPIVNIGTLNVSGTAVDLSNAGNVVNNLGNVTATSFTLDDSVNLAVIGTVAPTTSATIVDVGTLTVSGTVNSPVISLSSDNIALAGLVTDGGSGTVSLIATTGTINQSGGTLIAGTLSGSATSASLTQPGNLVATLGTFSTTGGFALVDNRSLDVAGPVKDTGVASTLSITTNNIGDGDITLSGLLSAKNIVSLNADGSICECSGGTLVAGTLTGSALGSADFSGGTNLVGTLAAFSTGAGLLLPDSESLTVTGPVVDTSVFAGVLLSTTGDLTLAGTVSATNQLSIDALGTISQTGGTLIANTLTGSATSASLTQLSNLIGTLDTFSTAFDFALVDNQALDVAGPVVITAGGTVTLTTKTGGITLGGTVSTSGVVDLISAGTISQSGGTLSAGTLTGSAATTASFSQVGNLVGTLGAFATKGGFALVDNEALVVSGPVTDSGAGTVALTTKTGGITLGGTVSTTGTVDLISAGAIAQSGGTLSAAVLTGSAASSASLTQVANLVGTLGAFSSSGGFALTDNEALLVSGPLVDSGAGAIALTTKTGGITLGGTVSTTGTVDLISAVGISQSGGTLIAGTLAGSAVSTASLTQAGNLVGTLGGFSTTGGFTLVDNEALSVSGPVVDSGAGTIALTTKTGGIAFGGTVSTTGLVDLVSAGAITQPGGTLSAGTLTGSATSASLSQVSNLVGTLGAFSTTGGFALVDNEALVVSGPVADSGAGTIAFTTKTGGIALAGAVSTTGTVDLTSAGAIAQSGGTLSAGTLTGSAATSASLTASNAVATLGGFTATSGFTLNDVPALSVSGAVNGGTSVAITDAGALTVGGSVTGGTVALTAAGISLPGSVSGPTSVTLTSSAGITETGSLGTALLTGSAATGASLTGTNSIATLGGFTATTGFTLMDVPALSVSGTVNGGTSVAITDTGALTVSGSVTGGTVALTAAGISLPGSVSGPTSVTLTSSAGITETGSLGTALLTGSASGSASLTGATPTTNQIASLGNFTASGFTLNDGTGLTVSGRLAGGPSVTIVDKGTLTVASGGTVTASAISLTADALAMPGLVTDGGSGTVALVANTGTINQTGTLIAGTLSGSASGAASLTGATPTTNQVGTVSNFTASGFTLDDGANLTLSGTVNGGPSVTLVGNGTINQTGTLIAGILSGSAIGAASFAGASATANQIGALGNFTSSGLVLNDGASLLIQGLVNAGASATINDAGAIGETGTLIAATLTGSAGGAANFTGTNQVDVLGNFSAAGFALNDGRALAVSGILNGGTSVALNAAGAITETGTIVAGSLSGSTPGAANFSGANANANQIASLGNFTAGGFTLADGRSLAINGTVDGGPSATVSVNGSLTINGRLTANTVTTTASGDITIPGTLQDANSVNLFSGGSVNETGVLIADLLTGNVAGDAIMTGNNQVIQLGSFTTGGRFVLNDGVNLTIGGRLTAPKITVNDFGNTLTFANAATIVTSGDIRPSGTSVPASLTPAGGAPGALLLAGTFNQLGQSFVTGIGGGPSTLQISVTGNMQIANLQAPGTWVILNVTGGQINGNVTVGALDVTFVQPNAGGQLSGSIAGFTGEAAAGAANIQPAANSNFRFNSCAIHSVNCVLLPTQGLPTANPLNDITIGSLFNPDDQDDLLLPIVSDQDY